MTKYTLFHWLPKNHRPNPGDRQSPPKPKPTSPATVSLLRDYLNNSTLHGLRYVGLPTITYFERSLFAVSFVVVSLCSAFFIVNIYSKWSGSPIIITLNARSTSITDIPFPAVTICNMNQARRGVVESFASDSNDALLLRSICGHDPEKAGASQTGRANDTSWHCFRKLLERVSQPCREMLLSCRYGSEPVRCAYLFQTVLTDEGLCCTFNAVDKRYMLQKIESEAEFDIDNDVGLTVGKPSPNSPFTPIDWTTETGYPTEDDGYDTYPRRAYGSGNQMGLTLVANVRVNDYYCSSTSSAGFKVLLHSPTETPKIADYGFAVAPGRESNIVVLPMVASAADGIRSMPRTSRKCVFASESRLVYYRTYTRKNCEMECEARLIAQTCGCQLYFMPRVSTVDATLSEVKICNSNDLRCSRQVRLTLAMGQNGSVRCDCLPGCFEINYAARLSSAALGSGFSVTLPMVNATSKEYLMKNYAVMHIFYEIRKFHGTTMEQFIGFTEFLSNIGGLLSLFTGFSFISAFELFYYICIRPYFVYRRSRSVVNQERRRLQKNQQNGKIVRRVKVHPYIE